MSTPCFISKKMSNDSYKSIYCHWDGYPDYVGTILKKHYKNPKKVDRLLNLGDISSLGDIVGRKHRFDRATKVRSTTAYHRDRGEPWEFVKPKYAFSLSELKQQAVNAEYLYIYDDGFWRWIRLR